VNWEKACIKLWDYLTDGKTDEEARKKLKISVEDFVDLKRKMMEREIARLSTQTTEEVYVKHSIAQIQNIRDLTDMIKEFKKSKQYNAMVGAVKARAELYDKLLKMGQDLGIIEKEAVKHEVVGGIVVSDLSSKELKKMITSELAGLNDMMKRYGSSNIIDIKPKPTHGPPKKTKVLKEKTTGGKKMRVAKGRRVVKTKVKAS